ncbi:hypothetical protein [Pectinatus frisingensis]|uniref:hypothetical protein n=1 Tax=Pectinatus frisingensis TaxID=865 RepID=UPI0018C63FD6|nr:hypothetical protein [Pectinatus frisingensis]
MKISTRIGIKSFLIYTKSLDRKTDKEAYLDLLESMIISSDVNSSKSIEVEGNNIAFLNDEELIRIGKIIIEEENLSEYYNQLMHQDDFFYEFKKTYNTYLKKAFEPTKKAFDDYNAYLSSIAESAASKFSKLKNVMVSIAKSIDIELLRKKVNKAERFNNIAIDLE